MIVRAALAALACLAARVAGQTKVCDTMDEDGNDIEVAFTKIPIDKDVDLPCAILAADICLLYTSPSPRDKRQSRMPSSA